MIEIMILLIILIFNQSISKITKHLIFTQRETVYYALFMNFMLAIASIVFTIMFYKEYKVIAIGNLIINITNNLNMYYYIKFLKKASGIKKITEISRDNIDLTKEIKPKKEIIKLIRERWNNV